VKRRWKLWISLFWFAMVIPVISWCFAVKHHILVRAYNCITLGMTAEEVEAMIGMPSGNNGVSAPMPILVRTGELVGEAGIPVEKVETLQSQTSKIWIDYWKWDGYLLYVAYDRSGTVVGCYLLNELSDEPLGWVRRLFSRWGLRY
jgi:hypothetical protein